MSEFGAQLKQARESRGISLRQIATSTKISTVALEALERGDLSKLPGGIFSRAFVKAYAIEVGLDPEEISKQFLVELGVHASQVSDDEVHPEVTADDRAFLERQRRAGLWLRVAVGVLIILIVLGVMWWRVANGAEATASTSIVTPQPVVATPEPLVPTLVSEPSASPAAAESQSALWIEVVTSASCWVQVTADGTVVPARVFAAGERQRFDAQREIVLQVGNAGVVSWTVNGKPARALGAVGDVRTVTISSATASEFFQAPTQAARPTPTASATARP
jgi:cytoskeleton protein RodZ